MPVELHLGKAGRGFDSRRSRSRGSVAQSVERPFVRFTKSCRRPLSKNREESSTMKTGNYEVMQNGHDRPVKMWTQGVPVEDAAKQQLANTAKMPFIYKWLA